MLDVRAEKIQAQRGNHRRKEGGDSREDGGKPCWFGSFRGGARRERREREEGEDDREKEVRD